MKNKKIFISLAPNNKNFEQSQTGDVDYLKPFSKVTNYYKHTKSNLSKTSMTKRNFLLI